MYEYCVNWTLVHHFFYFDLIDTMPFPRTRSKNVDLVKLKLTVLQKNLLPSCRQRIFASNPVRRRKILRFNDSKID